MKDLSLFAPCIIHTPQQRKKADRVLKEIRQQEFSIESFDVKIPVVAYFHIYPNYPSNAGSSFLKSPIFELQINDIDSLLSKLCKTATLIVSGPEGKHSERASKEEILHFIADDLLYLLYTIGLIANIASPGSLNLSNSKIMIGKKSFMQHDGFLCFFEELIAEHEERHTWPELKILKFKSVWEWAHKIPSFEKGTSSGPLGRALGALTYMTGESAREESSHIFWILLGLEALYCRGDKGNAGQIQEKSQLLFGEYSKARKMINSFYQRRSRLIHGDIDFPHNYARDYEYHFDYEISLYSEENSALALLIATLQYIASQNWKNLEFQYAIHGE